MHNNFRSAPRRPSPLSHRKRRALSGASRRQFEATNSELPGEHTSGAICATLPSVARRLKRNETPDDLSEGTESGGVQYTRPVAPTAREKSDWRRGDCRQNTNMMPTAHPDTPSSSSLSPVPAAPIESAAAAADDVKECGSELERLQLACTYLEKANDDLRSNLNEINHRFVNAEPPEDHRQHNLTSFFIEHKQPSAEQLNDEMEFEVEQDLSFKIRNMMHEHEVLNQNNMLLHEQLEKCRTELNRALTSKMQFEEELRRMKLQHENFLRDYEETMHERSTVLEENNRLHEEKESLKTEVKQLNQTMARLLSVKAEKAEAQARYGSRSEVELHDEVQKLRSLCDHLERQKEAALSKLRVAEEGFMNIEKWQHLTICMNFSNPNKNLGLVLGGGRDDEILGSSTPIYVHSISGDSTFAGQLQ
uniref:DUF3496 domain-containing protein n=1 Tax=Steinernema glaseri TaxID=37863 RepID=A0A1I8AIT7_9BILA